MLDTATRTNFTPDHEAFRDSVRRFLAAEFTPNLAQFEEDGKVSLDLWRKLGCFASGCLKRTAGWRLISVITQL
jgi:acyl-CoA dehydrogenase